MKLNDQQLADLYARLSGTADSIHAGLESIGLDSDDYDLSDVEDQLVDLNLELCAGCGWWMESCELIDENNDDAGYCDDCR